MFLTPLNFPMKKLIVRKVGSYKIIQCISINVYKLKFSNSLNISPVFSISGFNLFHEPNTNAMNSSPSPSNFRSNTLQFYSSYSWSYYKWWDFTHYWYWILKAVRYLIYHDRPTYDDM